MIARAALMALALALSAMGTASTFDPIDPRIRVITYNPDQIFRLTGHTGYQIALEFAAGERIETVAVGDAAGWQITPNAGANLLFVKPVGLSRPTNMTIVTNRRRYNFELVSQSGAKALPDSITYAVRFHYPETEAEKAPPVEVPLISTPPDQWNRAYTYEGAESNRPEEVFDDGTSTYFLFPKDTPTPAIFVDTPDAGESLVNFAVRGPYVVVEQVSPKLVLRQGKAVTTIYNDAFRAPTPGENAPVRRTKPKKRGLFGF
jgi:type IV secretion system protein VirB9